MLRAEAEARARAEIARMAARGTSYAAAAAALMIHCTSTACI